MISIRWLAPLGFVTFTAFPLSMRCIRRR